MRTSRIVSRALLAVSFSLVLLTTSASSAIVFWVCTPAGGMNCSTALPCASAGCFWAAGACTTAPLPLGLCLDGFALGCNSTNWCTGSCAGAPLSTCYCTANGCG